MAIVLKTFLKWFLKFERSLRGLNFTYTAKVQPAHFLEDLIHSNGSTHRGIVMPLEKKV